MNIKKVCNNLIQSNNMHNPGPFPEDSSNPGPVDLAILHVNDIHGTLSPFPEPRISTETLVGGASNLKSAIDEEKSKNPEGTLLLNAGDLIHGAYKADKTLGMAAVDASNPMGFDAMVLGNHEFYWGTYALRTIMSKIKAPVVAANVIEGKSREVMKGAQPYVIRKVRGVPVGIVGINTDKATRQTPPHLLDGIEVLDAIETLEDTIPKIKKDGAEVLVILSHLGFNGDVKIAQHFKNESLLIVGGHSHTLLPQGHREGNSFIVQAGNRGMNLGKLEFQYNREKKEILNPRARLIPILDSQYPRDPDIEKILNRYRKALKQSGGSDPMGHAAQVLDYSNNSGSGKLNQIVADSIKATAKTDVALASCMAVQQAHPSGPATRQSLYDIMPYDDWKIVTYRVTGAKLKELVEFGLRDGVKIFVPSGFRYDYAPDQPQGNRVTNMTATDGNPIDDKKIYSLGVQNYMAGLPPLKDLPGQTHADPLQDGFFQYFKDNCPSGGWKNDPDARIQRA